jgi:hypothetical protein
MLVDSTKWGLGRVAMLSVALPGLLAGCSSIEPDETPGELGNGAFRYVCVGEDAMCPDNGSATQFPERVATGARFDVTYQLYVDASGAEVSTASTQLIEPSGAAFRARRAGTAALLARRTVDGVTVDFAHLGIEDASAIGLETPSGQSMKLVMALGSSQELLAVPLDAFDAPLAGALSFDWKSSDPSVIALEIASPATRMRLTAAGSGTALLTVQSAALARELEVTVP